MFNTWTFAERQIILDDFQKNRKLALNLFPVRLIFFKHSSCDILRNSLSLWSLVSSSGCLALSPSASPEPHDCPCFSPVAGAVSLHPCAPRMSLPSSGHQPTRPLPCRPTQPAGPPPDGHVLSPRSFLELDLPAGLGHVLPGLRSSPCLGAVPPDSRAAWLTTESAPRASAAGGLGPQGFRNCLLREAVKQ